MRNFLKNEKGAALILTALSMVVLLGFAALALDGGYLYYRDMQMQDLSDTVALAAGQELPDPDKAKEKVITYSEENSIVIKDTETLINEDVKHTILYANKYPGEMLVKFNSDFSELKVDINIESELFFAKVLGQNNSQVGASAKVGRKKELAAYGKGLVPIGVVDGEFEVGETYNLSYGPPSVSGTTYSGNFGFINLDSYLPPESIGTNNAGATNFVDYLKLGYTGDETFEIGGTVNTVTGEKVGQVEKAINSTLPRNIIIPLIETFVDATGVERITIIGFAEFRLTEPYDDKNKLIIGEFVKRIEPGPGTSSSSSSSVTIENLQLLE